MCGNDCLIFILAAGAGITAVVVLTDALLQRSDLGRRRALEAPRLFVISLIIGRALLAGIFGVVTGAGLAITLNSAQGNHVPVDFIAATAILTLFAAGIAAIAPAISAGNQDPVRVLRTP